MTRGPAGVHRRLRVGACLSLSGEYARFGTQAARGLEAWQSLDGAAELIIADDRSDPGTLHAALPQIAARCDVLLGPYSTRLARVAGRLAARAGWLLWNHGGAGDDVGTAHLGHVVSVLAPASRYAAPFLQHLAATRCDVRLWVAHGRGSFGKQVAAGAEASARQAGISTARLGRDGVLPPPGPPGPWDLFSAGSFEEDVDIIGRARAARRPPRAVCAVAAGVREFGAAGLDARGVFGVGQWFPGAAPAPELGRPRPRFWPPIGPGPARSLIIRPCRRLRRRRWRHTARGRRAAARVICSGQRPWPSIRGPCSAVSGSGRPMACRSGTRPCSSDGARRARR